MHHLWLVENFSESAASMKFISIFKSGLVNFRNCPSKKITNLLRHEIQINNIFISTLNIELRLSNLLPTSHTQSPSPCSLVCNLEVLRQEVAGSNIWRGHYSFLQLKITFETGFISLSPLSIVSTMVMWESRQCGILVKTTAGNHGQMHRPPHFN